MVRDASSRTPFRSHVLIAHAVRPIRVYPVSVLPMNAFHCRRCYLKAASLASISIGGLLRAMDFPDDLWSGDNTRPREFGPFPFDRILLVLGIDFI